MEKLLERGHKITILTTHPTKYSKKHENNLKQIGLYEESYLPWSEYKTTTNATLSKMIGKLYELILSTQKFKNLINDKSNGFDLCLLASNSYPLFPLKDFYNCSLILLASYPGSSRNYQAFGNSINPMMMNIKEVENSDFFKRLYVTVMDTYHFLTYYFDWLLICDEIAQKHFGPNTRSVYYIENDAELIFSHEHYLIDGVKPLVPAIIPVFGMLMKSNKKLSHVRFEQFISLCVYNFIWIFFLIVSGSEENIG